MECLIVKLPDNREVLTYEKNSSSLLEFSKIFEVNLLRVETDSQEDLLDLNEIADLFCDQHKKPINSNYKLKNKLIKKTIDVKSHIENNLLEGNLIHIKEVHHIFRQHNISVSTIYRHLTAIKQKFKKEGKSIVKVSVGCYKLDS